MNTFLLILIGAPVLEIIVMIKIGAKIGTINTILLIMLTAVLGIYCARIAGLNTIRSGLKIYIKIRLRCSRCFLAHLLL